jgi:hypothetical protein
MIGHPDVVTLSLPVSLDEVRVTTCPRAAHHQIRAGSVIAYWQLASGLQGPSGGRLNLPNHCN